jgi:hypothetical protein
MTELEHQGVADDQDLPRLDIAAPDQVANVIE